MIHDQFFELLRAGLWGHPADASLFQSGNTNWDALMYLATQQSLLGITFDGIQTLPENLRPSRALYMHWCIQVARIEESNHLLDKKLIEIFGLYRESGLNPVLLKGQGVARSYIRPDHRQCGDIDIYLGQSGVELANQLLLRAGAEATGEETTKHTSFVHQNIHIENHRIVSKLNTPWADRYFQQWVAQWFPVGVRTTVINETNVALPPATFDALFIFIHAFIHLLNSGVGLRQVCDWARLLVDQKDLIDSAQFVASLRTMKLMSTVRAFGYVAVKYVGLPTDALPFSVDQAKASGEALLDEILTTGNFGHFDARVKSRPKGKWASKWYTFHRAVLRCYHLWIFAPLEATWYPIRLIQGSASIQLKQLIESKFRKPQ